jgi:hypothetical protein
MAAVGASLAAWLFPDFGVLRKGFREPSQLHLFSTVILVSWYLLIFVSFTIGQNIGSLVVISKKRPRSSLSGLESNVVYRLMTLLSTIGIGTTVFKIFQSMSFKEAILFVTLGQTNQLKDSLYQDYSKGLVSLRYLVLYPASLALYRIIRLKQWSAMNIFNVLLIGVSTFLSSRLILIATVLTTVFLLTIERKSMNLSIAKIGVTVGFLFLILSALNLSRNADFYERNHQSFWVAGVSEILAYVGSPFQAAIASAEVTDQLVAGGSSTYRAFVDEEDALMTNSAFVHLHEQMGYASWVYIAFLCIFMGFTFEALMALGNSIFLLPCGAILYASAELWRLDLFQEGTFIVWFVIGIGLPASLISLEHLWKMTGRAWRNADASRNSIVRPEKDSM